MSNVYSQYIPQQISSSVVSVLFQFKVMCGCMLNLNYVCIHSCQVAAPRALI